MKAKRIASNIALISSQIEAASSLLKFASDDLKELVDSHESIFHQELRSFIDALQMQCAILDGNAAFLSRLDLVDDSTEESDSGDSKAWRGEARF